MIVYKIDLSLKIIFKNMFRNLVSLVALIMGVSLFIIVFFILRGSKDNFLYNCEKSGSGFIKIHTLNFNNDSRYYLKVDDINSLKYSELSIKSISPETYFKGIITNKFTNLGCHVIGGSEDYKDFMVMDMMFGRFFSSHECLNKDNVIVIDNFTSMKLFGVENSLGREVYIDCKNKIHKYKVIGVMKYPSNLWKQTLNASSFCIIPVGTFIDNFNASPFFDHMYVSFEDNEYDNSNLIINFLKVKNGISKDIYQVESFMKQENHVKNMSNMFAKMVELTIVVFVFLNGLNIMNFMLCMIENRAGEIGVKKCVGANKADIFLQFIFESMVLSFFVGVGSLFIGVICSYFICLIMNIQFILTILNILILILICIFMGLIFGIIPALKACKIKPIDYLKL